VQQSVKIGTRGSPLALAQANEVKARLLEANRDLPARSVEIVIIKTTGDKILDRHLMNAGGKGLFTKEIEEALLEGRVDLAVHSTKDMPTSLPDGLILSTFLPREDVRDVFISDKAKNLNDLKVGATVGTASLRRRAQALSIRPDLNIITFRGTVETRIRKIKEGEADATFLALAGLNRLGLADLATHIMPTASFLPAPSQGAVCIEIRENDTAIAELLKSLHCSITATEVMAERAFLAALDGSCRTPIAAHATLDNDGVLILRGAIYSLDGRQHFSDERYGTGAQAFDLGTSCGKDMAERAGPEFFDKLKRDIAATIIE
jgi:hydroxymethylbilane synthase